MSVVRCASLAAGGLVAALAVLTAAAQPGGSRRRSTSRVSHSAVEVLSDTGKAIEATDLTVRLFTTAPVQTVQLAGRSFLWRTCTMCAAQSANVLVVRTVPGQTKLHVSGANRDRIGDRIFVEGEVRASTGDGRTAQVAGRWSVSSAQDGLHVLVQVPSERYVMAVLQAEASADEPMESLKALAVVARSFALQNRYAHGTDGLCDSTHCQALRFANVPARVREAVESTAGETLWLDGSVPRQVPGYFTQACGGETEDAASLWGGREKTWLTAHPDPFCVRTPALWHAELSLEQVRDALEREGILVPPVLAGLTVIKRDASGRVALLHAVGGLGPVPREALAAGKNGSSQGLEASAFQQESRSSNGFIAAATLRFALNRAYGWNELRSDDYRVSVVNGRVLFDGRGFGHGVGLCQAGARAAAEQGTSYRDILRFYFPGTSVRVLSDDRGWNTMQGHGWTVRTTENADELLQPGDAAWARARVIFPVAQPVKPVVTLEPTTELFRQATGQPGWDLAATRGEQISLQPAALIEREPCGTRTLNPDVSHRSVGGGGMQAHGERICLNELLEHEFLHVLVESQSSNKAPLWLREGLVEALAGEHSTAAGKLTPAQINEELMHAGSRAESQRAHATACELARQAVARYGLSTVRGWLRDGVPPVALTGQ